jgi:predicted dehydrogenase
VTVAAVAARDPVRARHFAARHRVPVTHPDYATLVADPELDAIYIPLPNGLHERWTLAALAEGKHVLCEKPLTSNAEQAQRVADAVAHSGLVVMEAFHYRYHPLIARVVELLADGAIGAVRHVRTSMCFPLPRFGDIRYRLDLAGGATMDAGCYAVNALRLLAGEEPAVESARATLRAAGVDRAMTATFRFPSGATGELTTSLWSRHLLGLSARVQGDAGWLSVFNYVMPSAYHRLTWHTAGRTYRTRVPGEATYVHQLRAFVAAVRDGTPVPTDATDAVRNMRVIDDIYRAAGLTPRS